MRAEAHRRVASVAAAAVISGSIVLLAAIIASGTTPATVQVTVTPGISPQRTSAEVVALAEAAIRNMATGAPADILATPIVPRTAAAMTASEVPNVKPDAPTTMGANGVVWVVEADGPFVGRRGRADVPLTAQSGYVLIDDATGDVLGFGFP